LFGQSVGQQSRFVKPKMSFTNFGFQRILKSEKQQKVHEIFKRVAGSYDLMNDFMSVGVHRIWKKSLVTRVIDGLPVSGSENPYTLNLLDLCGGTGDISFGLSEKLQFKEHRIRCIDINADMLQVGKQKLQTQPISFEEGNAQELNTVEDRSQDSVTVAFGIRNCTEPSKVLEEAYRVLKPGGKFYCLEFSHVTNPLLKP
jgi:2-methoxy-6-polyprenyl-1,4-benzoquinol methylase